MTKTVSTIALLALVTVSITGCSDKEAMPKETKYTPTFECKVENVLAPRWTCIPDVTGYYAGVGIANKSAAGMAHMRKVAVMNGRSDLTQQIKTKVKDKMEGFTETTGMGDAETVDHVTTSVTSQLAGETLSQSKAVDMWTAPSGALYMLVTIPEDAVNSVVKNSVKTSLDNDNARWQQYRSEDAQKKLDAAFPTD